VTRSRRPTNSTPSRAARKVASGPDAAATDPHFAAVVKAFARDARVTSGKMFASMGLKVDGKIFAMQVKGAFVAKLPRARVDELVRAKRATHFDPGHGRLMKEWVSVKGDVASWVGLAQEARLFVGGAPSRT
jgi:hypothetical protein